ncbi:hypothetical protein [Croceicoccus pelagius]|uniref:hypothetical protein n=1 Tax=Croceicoccus pelagius TaxID=1703341 RepID=UPI00082EBE07|nr:hypothetical protein [Croceicoccus pelagius]
MIDFVLVLHALAENTEPCPARIRQRAPGRNRASTRPAIYARPPPALPSDLTAPHGPLPKGPLCRLPQPRHAATKNLIEHLIRHPHAVIYDDKSK